jgi:hypothetical protein
LRNIALISVYGQPQRGTRVPQLPPGEGDWAPTARSAVASLRIAAASHPHDQQLMNLIGELSMRSEPFRGWWAAQDVFVGS